MKAYLGLLFIFFASSALAATTASNHCLKLQEKVKYLQSRYDNCVRKTSHCRAQLDEMDTASAIFKECATRFPTAEDPESCRSLRYCVSACDQKKVAALNLEQCQKTEDPHWKDQACRTELNSLRAAQTAAADCQ